MPSVADEQFRDLVRVIEDCRGDLIRARHRLSKMLLRREIPPDGAGFMGSAWTTRHMDWLRGLRFDDRCSRATFVDHLSSPGWRCSLLGARR